MVMLNGFRLELPLKQRTYTRKAPINGFGLGYRKAHHRSRQRDLGVLRPCFLISGRSR